MKNFFDKLRLFGTAPNKTESFIEVVDVLTTLRDGNSDISVLVDGAEGSFTSKVRALNARHRIMVIDSAEPDFSLPPLNYGRKLTLRSASSSREINFSSRFLEPFLPDPRMGYQIEMPIFLGMEHARGAFRVLLDELRHKVRITLIQSETQPITGVVANLSKSGVGMTTKYELPGSLRSDSRNVECLIELNNSEEISCRMEIRNVRQQSNGETNTYVGGRMVDISRRDSNLLEEFIEHIQEQRLQALLGSS